MIKYNGVQYDESEIRGNPPPAVGSDIYVGASQYLTYDASVHDFQGGKCQVSRVSVETYTGTPAWFVRVVERQLFAYDWETLRKEQEKLRAEFGEERGHPEPDNDPEANRW